MQRIKNVLITYIGLINNERDSCHVERMTADRLTKQALFYKPKTK